MNNFDEGSKVLEKNRALLHAIFDIMWHSGKKTKQAAYAWLAEKIGIDVKDCDIEKFDIELVKKAIQICVVEDTLYLYESKICLKNIT